MNKYEVAIVISSLLGEEERAAVLDQAKGYIERHGGNITEVADWGKRKLAYEIQKQAEGYFYFVKVDAEPNMSVELEKELRIMENLLRYLIVRVDE